MPDNFQRSRAGHRQDSPFERAKHLHVCRGDGHRRQYAERHAGNGQEATKRLLEGVSAYQHCGEGLENGHRESAPGPNRIAISPKYGSVSPISTRLEDTLHKSVVSFTEFRTFARLGSVIAGH